MSIRVDRKRAHADVDQGVDIMLATVKKDEFKDEAAYTMSVNFLHKVYRPYLHVLTDAEFDQIDHRAVTFGMAELCVSMASQMATRVVPSNDRAMALGWYHQMAKAIVDGMTASCHAIWPPTNKDGDTLQ